MTCTEDRSTAVHLISEAVGNGARVTPACAAVKISTRTYKRWLNTPDGDGRPMAIHPTPPNALTELERSEVLMTCHEPEYRSLPPPQIVPMLSDVGEYLACKSTFYRVLHAANEQHSRGRARAPHKVGPPRSHTATGPNQVWTWDVTYLKGPVRGLFFFLYMIVDIFSRKIVS